MSLNIEVLIATMHRTDFTFLNKMFEKNEIRDFDVLIVNQTSRNKILVSDNPRIRVINSFKFGTPKSRNIALNNANGDVLLIADDDIIYEPNLLSKVTNAYLTNDDADMITFEAINEFGNLQTNYPDEKWHSLRSLKHIYSWVITFRRKSVVTNKVFYNEYFGGGSEFIVSDEYVFLVNCFRKGLKIWHKKESIVMHPELSSGRSMGSDDIIYANSAMYYRFYGNLSYIWLLKYAIYMWKDNYIKFHEIPRKFRVGLSGIKKYKALAKAGKIDKIYVD